MICASPEFQQPLCLLYARYMLRLNRNFRLAFFCFRRDILSCQAHLLNELIEFQAQEQVVQLRFCWATEIFFWVERQGSVGDDCCQVVAHSGIGFSRLQFFQHGRFCVCLGHGGVEGVHCLIFLDQRHRRLFTNSLDARNVVAGVAHECLQVDDVDGVEAVYLPE